MIALTHMRGPNDHRLAEEVTGIDLILGGHDHDYFSQKVYGYVCSSQPRLNVQLVTNLA